nr:MAG TPA: hypothetical protein [Caudoviricetes sp.]
MIYVPHNIFRQLNLHSPDVCMVSLVYMAYSFLQRKKDAPYRKHPSLYNFSLSSLKYLFLIFPAIPYYRNNIKCIGIIQPQLLEQYTKPTVTYHLSVYSSLAIIA